MSVEDYGSFGERVSAFIIDYVLVIVLSFVLGFILGVRLAIEGAHQEAVSFLAYILGFVTAWLYSVFFETSTYMATPGKTMMGLKVITEEGERLSFGRATGRYFSKMFVLIACFAMFWSPKRQCAHDMMVGTLVVRSKKN